MKHPTDAKYVNMKPKTSLKRIEPFRENSHLQLKETIYSDELYNWQLGKAPWAVEKGGIGVPPTSLRLEQPWEKFSAQKIPDVKYFSDAAEALQSAKLLVLHFDKFLSQLDVSDKEMLRDLEIHSAMIKNSLNFCEHVVNEKQKLEKETESKLQS